MKKIGLISLEQRNIYEERLAIYPTVLSEQTFTNMFMWRKARPIYGINAGDSLIAFEERDLGAVLFGTPIGPISLADAATQVQEATGRSVAGFERVGEPQAEGGARRGLAGGGGGRPL